MFLSSQKTRVWAHGVALAQRPVSTVASVMTPVVLASIVLASIVSPALAKKKKKEEKPVEAAIDSTQRERMHRSWGQRYLKNKQYEDAETQLTKAWEFDSTSEKTSYYLGKLYNETDKTDEAIEWFRKSLDLDPKGGNTKNIHYYLGALYTRVENRPGAIDAYSKLLKMAPEPKREAQYLHQLVSLYIEEEDYEKALELARRWAELKPDDPDVQDTLAKLALYAGEEDEALEQMQKVLEMNPEDYATLDRLADMYRERGMTKEAFAAYSKLSDNSPDNYLYLDYLLELGRQMRKSKRFQIETLNKMLALQPDNLGVIEQLVDETGSFRMLNRGLRLDPGSGKLNYLKGDHYYQTWKNSGAPKDSVTALKWFRKATSDPQWQGNAQRMISELDPPLTDEEKMLRDFFKKKEKKEDQGQKGKK